MNFLFESGLTISNSAKDASKDSKWSNPGASLYDKIMESPNWKALLKEAYLIGDINKIKKNETSYSASGCKYPHHKIVGDKLVVSEAGIKAAYSRAKQMGIFNGKVKSHIIKHYRELGLLKDSNINEASEVIIQNFDDIEMLLEAVKAKTSKSNKRKEGKLYPVYLLSRHLDRSKVKDENEFKRIENSFRFSDLLKRITNGSYSHAGISLKDDLSEIYSFATITDSGSGFNTERIGEARWSSCSIYVAVAFIDYKGLQNIKKFLNDLKYNRDKSKYQFMHLLKILLNQRSGSDYKFICSTFLGYILYLADIRNLNRNFNLIKPDDVTVLPKTFYIMNIDSDEWNRRNSEQRSEFKHRALSIYKSNIKDLLEYNNSVPKYLIQNSITKTSSFDNLINELILKYYYKRG